jgi:hypothetical protein
MLISDKTKLIALLVILTGLSVLAAWPVGNAAADGPGGFPTSTAMIIIVPTFTPTPTSFVIPTFTSAYPFPLPQDNTLNLTLPEAQAETIAQNEDGGGISTVLCIPVAIVAVIIAIIGLNRIRKNYQGE